MNGKKIVLFLVIILTGCTSVKESRGLDDDTQGENTISENIMDYSTDYITDGAITGSAVMDVDNNKSHKLINWKEAKIVDIGFYPRFAESTVAQDDKYIFYPDEGDKIMRVEKTTGERKCIFKLQDVKEGTGAQLCLAGNKLFIEYEGTIYRCSVDGSRVKIIADDTKERFASLIENCSLEDEWMIRGMEYYRGNLYLFTDYCSVVKLDLKSGEFAEVAEAVDSACFYGSSLYCADVYDQYLCKINLNTEKKPLSEGRKEQRGNKKNIMNKLWRLIIRFITPIIKEDVYLLFIGTMERVMMRRFLLFRDLGLIFRLLRQVEIR
ncbi:MAG: hypothetical protein K6G62_05630 [Eubacterium sp.]|nr:hypothetical protein [Eubacterium sp.]